MGILSLIASFVGSLLAKLFTSQQDRKDKIELGQERQANVTLKEDAKRGEAVRKAESSVRGDDAVKGDMDRGTF